MVHSNKQALVVDEEAWWRELTKYILTDQGWQVQVSDRLDQGLTEAGKREYDIILISDDVLDNSALKAHLRRLIESGRRIVLVSAVPDWQRTREAFLLGATDHITKSIQEDEIRPALIRHLNPSSP